MDDRSQKFFKTKPRGINQEVILPDFPDDDNTVTTTFTKSRRVSFGTNFIKEFIVGSAVSAQCVTEYERAFSSSDSSNPNSSHSAMESEFFDKENYALEESQKSNQMPPPEPDVLESRAKVPKISSTICFSADSPTTEMEFTEGCISLAKSILDKKNKDMTVIIQANRKDEEKGKTEETKIFEGSQFDMSITKCFKSKENKTEERRFEGDKTRIFNKFDDDISFTRCNKVFETEQSKADDNDGSDSSWVQDDQKENQIPLDLIMKHLDKDDSNFENSLFSPKKHLNEVLGSKPLDVSIESEKLNWNESMDISSDSPLILPVLAKCDSKESGVSDDLNSGTENFQEAPLNNLNKNEEDSILEMLSQKEKTKAFPEEMEITFVKEMDISSDVIVDKAASSVEANKDLCGDGYTSEKVKEKEDQNVSKEQLLDLNKYDLVIAKSKNNDTSYIDREPCVEAEIPNSEVFLIHDDIPLNTSTQHSTEKLNVLETQDVNVVHECSLTDNVPVSSLSLKKVCGIPPSESSFTKPEEETTENNRINENMPESSSHKSAKISNSNDTFKESQALCGVTFTEEKMEVEELKVANEEGNMEVEELKVANEEKNMEAEELKVANEEGNMEVEVLKVANEEEQSIHLNKEKSNTAESKVEGTLERKDSIREEISEVSKNVFNQSLLPENNPLTTSNQHLEEEIENSKMQENVVHEFTLPEDVVLNTSNQQSEGKVRTLKIQDENLIPKPTFSENIPFNMPPGEEVEETPALEKDSSNLDPLIQGQLEPPQQENLDLNKIILSSQPPVNEKMEEDTEEAEISKNVQQTDMSLTKACTRNIISIELTQDSKSLVNESMDDFMDLKGEKANELLNSKGEVSLTGLIEMDETLNEINVTEEQPVKEKSPSAKNNQSEITTCFLYVKAVKSLEEQSTEPGCIWSLTDFKSPQSNTSGFLSFNFQLLESSIMVKFFLEMSDEDDLDSCKIMNSNLCLNTDNKLRLPEYKTVLDFGLEKFRIEFKEVRKGISTIHHVSFFLDQMNLFVQKTNPFLQQVYSILTLYPNSKLENSMLTFRLFSYPLFFSCNVSMNLSDFSKMSKSSLLFSFDFGSLDKKKIAEIFEECLKVENALCEFIIRSTEYLIEQERKTGRISNRKHIRLLSTKKKD